MKEDVLIRLVRPYIVSNGKPTALTRRLSTTVQGRAILQAIIAYYCVNSNPKTDIPVDTDIDIEEYRYVRANYTLTCNRDKR